MLTCWFLCKKNVTPILYVNIKVKVSNLCTGPEGSRTLRLQDFETVGTGRWSFCQSYAPAAFTPWQYSRYSFLLDAESTPEL